MTTGDLTITKLLEELEERDKAIKCLTDRIEHLLKSEYIADFDKKNPTTGEYERDISEADNIFKKPRAELKVIRTTPKGCTALEEALLQGYRIEMATFVPETTGYLTYIEYIFMREVKYDS